MPTVAPLTPIPHLFLCAPDTDLSQLITEVDRLARAYPGLLAKIEADQDALGLSKKMMRKGDREWYRAQNGSLPGFDLPVVVRTLDGLELGVGRPRMPAIIALFFLVLRGYLGGCKDRKIATQLVDSVAIRIYLNNRGYDMPGLSTIIDNVNAVSVETREHILDATITIAKQEKLDDFKEITCDSTSVSANSAWPSDSGTIAGLLARAERMLCGLVEFGIVVTTPAVVKKLLDEVEQLHKQIQMTCGKKDSERKRKKLYRKLFKIAEKIRVYLRAAYGRAYSMSRPLNIPPSVQERIDARLDWIDVDLKNVRLAMENGESRVLHAEKVPAQQKIISLSDEDAAMIVKGGREPVVGYKPQIARSKSGFVTAIIVPEGNANDSGQIEIISDASIKRTGVIPDVLSFDDGYTNTSARAKYKNMGIEVVSFSGSKGKNVIPFSDYDSEEYRQARNDRSAVESGIFTLKHNFAFGEVMRRGITRVRAELYEKVIACNLFRLIEVRDTRQFASTITEQQKDAA